MDQGGAAFDAPGEIDRIIADAVSRRASDIHLEPTAKGCELRYRIDGLLTTVRLYPPEVGRSLVNRLMVLAHLLTYRLDVPQEGRLNFNSPDANLELRLAVIPISHGIRAALRLPADLVQPRRLEQLGLPPAVSQKLLRFAAADAGMLIVTGPAGSGKTTTIYALLERIVELSTGLSIIALEDPIERDLPGVTQIEVSSFGQLTYEKALRSIMRQDPQVLMLGEIRDAATASLAVQAALSGHRLICTLHAATPGGAIARLFEMGLEPYQITSALFGVVSQRLLRRSDPEGYRGRVPVAEIVLLDEPLRGAILQRADADAMRRIYNQQEGFVSLADAAAALVNSGRTNESEVRRVLAAASVYELFCWVGHSTGNVVVVQPGVRVTVAADDNRPQAPFAASASFAYEAQTREGHSVSGIIHAPTAEAATEQLHGMHLRILGLRPAEPGKTKPARALTGQDFIIFNQQLAQLMKAGLPLDRGLRLIARDMRRGRLSHSIEDLARDLETGRDLSQVFEDGRTSFPPAYSDMLQAGIRSGNLPGVLFSLVRHLEMTQRLRGLVWRCAAYPLIVLVALTGATLLISQLILPQFEELYQQFRIELPPLTLATMAFARWAPWVLLAGLIFVFASLLLLRVFSTFYAVDALRDALARRMPLSGPIVRASLTAAWCDSMRMAVEAGIDLPGAVELAGNASRSAGFRIESARLREQLERTGRINGGRDIIPATALAAIEFGCERNDLPATLASLGEMYQRQAEMRSSTLPTVLMPILIGATGVLIGGVILSIFMPLLWLMRMVGGL